MTQGSYIPYTKINTNGSKSYRHKNLKKNEENNDILYDFKKGRNAKHVRTVFLGFFFAISH